MHTRFNYLQYLWLDLLEEVDEFNVGWEQKLASRHAAVVELGV